MRTRWWSCFSLTVACADVRGEDPAEGGVATTFAADDESSGAAQTGAADSASTAAPSDDGDDAIDTGAVFDVGTMPDVPALCDLPPPGDCAAEGDPFRAIGLGCEHSPISDATFVSSDARAWAIATSFGTATDPMTSAPMWSPQRGDDMLVLSTGVLVDAGGGAIELPSGFAQTGDDGNGGNSNYNGDGKPLPAPLRADDGSNGGQGGTPFVDCDGVGDCSGSLAHQWASGGAEANDLLWLTFTATAPANATGFAISFDYFSAEFPEWVGSQYNDVFVIWAESELYSGNLCFLGSDPCTVTALWPAPFQENAPELAGTGFDGVGGATGWFTARGPVVGGAPVRITFALFDMGDTILDTTVLLDDFHWECEGCDPAVQDCGVTPEG